MNDDLFNQISDSMVKIRKEFSTIYNLSELDVKSFEYNEDGSLKSFRAIKDNEIVYYSLNEPFSQIKEYKDENGETVWFTVRNTENGRKKEYTYNKDGSISKEVFYSEDGSYSGYMYYSQNFDGSYTLIEFDKDGNKKSERIAQYIPKNVNTYLA